MEYAIDVAQACREKGIKSVAVTAGYMSPAPRAEFYRYMDAANVDLKAFTEDFYQKICGARLAPVLETLEYLRHETDVWFEITTLLIPGLNDSDEEIGEMTRWMVDRLGPVVPLHFTAYHPDWKMRDRPATPSATLRRARDIARANGLSWVYTGNVHDPEGQSTVCPGCGATPIARDGYEMLDWNLARTDGAARAANAARGLRRVTRRLGRAQAARHPQGAMTRHRVRTPAVAGTFYPARPGGV